MKKITTDPKEIREWAEMHGGNPAKIDHPVAQADTPGIRINFPGPIDEAALSKTQDVSWDEFFRIFERQRLMFIYDTQAEGNDPTTWYSFRKRSDEARYDEETLAREEDITVGIPTGEVHEAEKNR